MISHKDKVALQESKQSKRKNRADDVCQAWILVLTAGRR